MNRKGHIASSARKHYFNLYNASGGFSLAMHRAGSKENRGHFNRITPTPLDTVDRSNRGIREFAIVRMKLIVLAWRHAHDGWNDRVETLFIIMG